MSSIWANQCLVTPRSNMEKLRLEHENRISVFFLVAENSYELFGFDTCMCLSTNAPKPSGKCHVFDLHVAMFHRLGFQSVVRAFSFF